jgi:hypothetical protein
MGTKAIMPCSRVKLNAQSQLSEHLPASLCWHCERITQVLLKHKVCHTGVCPPAPTMSLYVVRSKWSVMKGRTRWPMYSIR